MPDEPDPLHEAIDRIAAIRRKDPGGDLAVKIVIGPQERYRCTFRDRGRLLGAGGSGRSLLEAVEGAVAEASWAEFARQHTAVELAEYGARKFERADVAGARVFNTAGAEQAYRNLYGHLPPDGRLVPFLEANPRIVRLAGGCHWLLLPEGLTRYVPAGPPDA